MKSKAITTAWSGNECKHCGNGLVWKEHPTIGPKQLKKAFYFKRWEYCLECKTVWFHEEDKVWNDNAAGRALRVQLQDM